MIDTFWLAIKFFKREFRSGELSLLFLSLVIATGSLSSVGFLIKRVDDSMNSHANQLNGAQLILKSSTRVPDNWLDKADSFQLEQAQMQVFPSMLVVNDEFKLAQIKAVSDNFPLQGELRVQKKQTSSITKAPPKGEIWLDKRLALLFNMEQKSHEQNSLSKETVNPLIELGESEFQATGVLERVPGQSSSFFTIAPSAMINLSDLALTATVQPGSRVDYIYFFSNSVTSTSQSLNDFQQWLKVKLKAGQTLRSGVDDLKAVNASLQKAGDFLSLAAILTVLLSAIAIAINSHRYGQKQYKNNAIMLCLGCSEKRIILIELYKLFALGLAGCFIGITLGYMIYLGLLSVLDELINLGDQIGQIYFYYMPAWVGLICGLFLLLSLSMANLSRLRQISPVGLIRKASLFEDNFNKGSMTKNKSGKVIYLVSFVGLILLSIWYTENTKITLLFYFAFSISAIVLYLCALFILNIILKIGRKYQLINRLSLLNLKRHKRAVLLQVSTFSLIFSLLIIIFLVRTELLDNWQQKFPEHTPNHFVINIQSYEKMNFEQYLQQNKIETQGLFPMVRGRLISLNNEAIIQAVPDSAREHNALHRELNLSYDQNKVLSSAEAKAEISIERSLAKTLNIRQGDLLGFRVGSRQIEGVVTQIRVVKWDSFQPNFYVIFSSGLIEQYPMTWISSFYLAGKDKIKLNQLMEQFPGITIIEVDEILKEVQFIIERVSDAIELIFLFIILAGILILSSSLLSTMATRMYENAVIRTLGASIKQLRHYLFVEFIVVALLSAFIAIILAEFAIYILYQQVFQMNYSLHPDVWFGIAVISLLVICGLGMIVVNKIFTQSVQSLLSQFTE
ncbi:MAG: FtsX-like permease family protein [Gammaproteobacteria bacterium]|nr:FtsX-like permease family protein [Gammaproteobacteria bacterium]